MGRPQIAPKTSALLVAAIRKLRNIHGSTSREITNYITSECDAPAKNIQRQMKLALRRGLSTGVLHRSKEGYYTCPAFDDLEVPGDRSRGGCGRKRKRARCGRRKKSRSRCRSKRRRSRGRKRGCRKRRSRKRRGMKCARRRRKSSCRRRKRKCGGRRHEDGAEVDAPAARKSVRKQQPKSKTSSRTSSQLRMSSASSGTQRSEADTLSATLSASGKESLSDQSDISGTSDGTGGETKP